MSDPARLVSIPDAPIPDGADVRWLETARARLRAALFTPPGSPRGTVVLSPGRTEPIEKYFEVVRELQGRGFVVLVHDWAGQGFSTRYLDDPLKGHALGWRPFLRGFEAILKAFADRMPRPWIALGHSMGGGLTTLALSEGMGPFQAAVLSAPMLGVKLGGRDPLTTRLFANLMGLVGQGGGLPLPQDDPLNNSFDTTVLTHDRARFERFQHVLAAAPELRLGSPTWSWIAFALALSARLTRPGVMESVVAPFTVVMPGDERLVDNDATRAAVARAPRGRLVEVAGAYHEVLMETDDKRAQFWAAFDETVAGL